MLPPHFVRTGGAFEYQFPGVDVQHTIGRIIKRDMMYHHREEDCTLVTSDSSDPGDSDDFSFGRHFSVNLSDGLLYDEDSSDEHSSEYWSNSDQQSLGESGETNDDWADHDTALSIFLQSRN